MHARVLRRLVDLLTVVGQVTPLQAAELGELEAATQPGSGDLQHAGQSRCEAISDRPR